MIKNDNLNGFIHTLSKGNGDAYGWICTYGHVLSKDELINICKELIYAAYYEKRFDNEIMINAAEELTSLYNEEEDE